MDKILVTGAAGFIGSHLVRALVRQGASVVGLVRPSSNLWRLQDVLKQVQLLQVELGSSVLDQHQESLKEVDTIYHLAAASLNPPLEHSQPLVQTNVLGTLHLLNLAMELKVKRFIYCGSCFEYPSGECLSEDRAPWPISEYAASKSAGWLLANAFHRRYGLPVTTLRAFTVYGPFESAYRLVPYTINKVLEGKPVDLTAGEQTRDFVYIEDMIDALLKVVDVPGAVGGTFNVCTGIATPVRELAKTVSEMTGIPVSLKYGARSYRDAELMQLSGDPSKAREMLNWASKKTLKEGLSLSIEWFRENRLKYPVYAQN